MSIFKFKRIVEQSKNISSHLILPQVNQDHWHETKGTHPSPNANYYLINPSSHQTHVVHSVRDGHGPFEYGTNGLNIKIISKYGLHPSWWDFETKTTIIHSRLIVGLVHLKVGLTEIKTWLFWMWWCPWK